MEDVQLARKSASAAKSVVVPTAATQRLAEADEGRLSITFSSDGVTTVWIQPEGINSATLTGLTLTPTNPVLKMTIYDHGDIVTKPWTAFGGAADANVAVVTMSLGKR
jgi:hypothetical protein